MTTLTKLNNVSLLSGELSAAATVSCDAAGMLNSAKVDTNQLASMLTAMKNVLPGGDANLPAINAILTTLT